MQFEHEGNKYRIVFRHSKPMERRRFVVEEIGQGDSVPASKVVWPSGLLAKCAPSAPMRLVREIEPRDRLRRVTTCEIQEFVGKKWAYYRFGAAQCSHEDQFRKEYARRMSLGRALARVDEDNPFYGKALAAYYGRKKGKAA